MGMQGPGAPCSVVPDRQGPPPTAALEMGGGTWIATVSGAFLLALVGQRQGCLVPCSVQDGATRQRCISSTTPACLPQHSLSGNTPRAHSVNLPEQSHRPFPNKYQRPLRPKAVCCFEISFFLGSVHQGLKPMKGWVSFGARCLLTPTDRVSVFPL